MKCAKALSAPKLCPSRGVWGHSPQKIFQCTISRLAQNGCFSYELQYLSLHRTSTLYYSFFAQTSRSYSPNRCINDLFLFIKKAIFYKFADVNCLFFTQSCQYIEKESGTLCVRDRGTTFSGRNCFKCRICLFRFFELF